MARNRLIWGRLAGLVLLAAAELVAALGTRSLAEEPVILIPLSPERQRAREEKRAAFAASLARDHGYALAPGENVRCIAPPFTPQHIELNRAFMPSSPQMPLMYQWSDGRLHLSGMMAGETVEQGTELRIILTTFGIRPPLVEGSPQALKTRIPGDWVVRAGAEPRAVCAEIDTILHNRLHLAVRVEARDLERSVWVITGRYEYSPFELTDKERPPDWAQYRQTHDLLQIFGSEMADDDFLTTRAGTFDQFVQDLIGCIGMPIVSEIDQPPTRPLCWTTRQRRRLVASDDNRDPVEVLATVAEQTGLHFDKVVRKIPIVVVEEEEK